MKCSIKLHFIWIFTDCKSTRLREGFPVYKGLKLYLSTKNVSTETSAYKTPINGTVFICCEANVARFSESDEKQIISN